MPEIGEIKYVKRFAWFPTNLFPQYIINHTKAKARDYIFLRLYYKVYKWCTKSWVVNDPDLQGWTWLGNSRSK